MVFHVVKIHPEEFWGVKDAGRLSHGVKGEFFNQLILGKDLLVAVRPAETDQVINQGLREVAHLPVRRYRGSAMPFAEAGLFQAKKQGTMGELRGGISPSL